MANTPLAIHTHRLEWRIANDDGPQSSWQTEGSDVRFYKSEGAALMAKRDIEKNFERWPKFMELRVMPIVHDGLVLEESKYVETA